MGFGLKRFSIVITIATIVAWPGISFPTDTDHKPARPHVPPGVFIELTDDFYRALKNDRSMENRVYTNRVADEYLRQIAISTRYMVETNLRILDQQDKIIQLLEEQHGKQ
ncbi:MAG: hypothetical protein JRH15_16895 [Deltaproteobacteria bacterium]|nr:hypothetical protein [Deltaproteobacteria bacterium]